MLLITEERIRGRIFHTIHRYAKANDKYMKNQDKNKKSSYLMYLDANNLYGWAMSQKLPVNDFKWKKILPNLSFYYFNKKYFKDSNKVYMLEIDIKYIKSLHNLQYDLPFLPERMKIKMQQACMQST